VSGSSSNRGEGPRQGPRGIWIWRAFDEDRSRICDSGSAIADSAATAEGIAWQCLGGPHKHEVVEIEVDLVAHGEPLATDALRAARRDCDARRDAFLARRRR